MNSMQFSHDGWEAYYAEHRSDRAWGGLPDGFLMEYLDEVLPQNASSVLDVAAGDGRNSWPFLERDLSVTAVDLSLSALATFAARSRSTKSRKPVLISGDFLTKGLIPGQFDCAVCFNSIPHFEAPAAAIRRIAELLRVGGRMAFNAFTPDDVAFGQGERVGNNRYYYQNTLFSFMSEADVRYALPAGVTVLRSETRRWDEADHGAYRQGWHTHEACFFILEKSAKM